MMASPIPRTPCDVARQVRMAGKQPSKIGQDLSTIERIALECIKQIASEGRRATREEICAAIGSDNYDGGTVAGVLFRLWDKGKITRTLYQRGMVICLTDSGVCTAPPKNEAPHWLERTERVPAPAIQSVRERDKPMAAMIEAEARRLGRNLSDFLSDLVYIGFHEFRGEQESGE